MQKEQKKQAAAEKRYIDQLREADFKAQQAKISELNAIHEIELTRKRKEQEEEKRRSQDQLQALSAELRKLKAKLEADSAIAAQMAENQAAAAEPRVMWSPSPPPPDSLPQQTNQGADPTGSEETTPQPSFPQQDQPE